MLGHVSKLCENQYKHKSGTYLAMTTNQYFGTENNMGPTNIDHIKVTKEFRFFVYTRGGKSIRTCELGSLKIFEICGLTEKFDKISLYI